MQFDSTGRLRHLITLEDFPYTALVHLLECAGQIRDAAVGRVDRRGVLHGVAVCTLFFEPSTRTRSSFELAARRLGADVLHFDVSTSSTRKGETDLDTLKNLEAMGIRGFIMRHPDSGAVLRLASQLGQGTTLINAGDGQNAHPTQALQDMLTLRQAKGNNFSDLKVLIVGDIKHSRVARSNLHALRTLKVKEIRVCGPKELLPDDHTMSGCVVDQDLDAMIDGVDVVMMLRLQHERIEAGIIGSIDTYVSNYRLDGARLARAAKDAIVLHPGPINRGIEITDAVVDGPQSWVLRQVANGVAVRMAVLNTLLHRNTHEPLS